jgi:hypothetical protein
MPLVFSRDNLTKTATITGGAVSTTYPTEFLKAPERPFLQWKSTGIATTQEVILDFGSAVGLNLVGLVNVNFASATIQAASSSGFASPAYTQAVTPALNPWNWRYHYTLYPLNLSYRYLRVKIPAQTPIDNLDGFTIGGIWTGGILAPPSGWRWGAQFQTRHPHQDVGPEHGGWRQRLILGEPITVADVDVGAQTHMAQPGKTDQVASWQSILYQLRFADYYYVYSDLGDPAQGWVMRQLQDVQWQVNPGLSQAHMTFEEVVGP